MSWVSNTTSNIQSNYPTMSDLDWDNAPFNDKDYKTISVTVSITLSKQFTVKIDEYKVEDTGKNEDGSSYEEVECSEDTLKKAVEEQINLPPAAGSLFKQYNQFPPYIRKKISKDLSDWCIDDFEVIQD